MSKSRVFGSGKLNISEMKSDESENNWKNCDKMGYDLTFKSTHLILYMSYDTTTLKSLMNAKLSKRRFWHCHANGLIKTIQTIPHNLYMSEVDFPLLWIKAYPGLS